MSDDVPLLDTIALDNLIAATSREFAQELTQLFRTVSAQALTDMSTAIAAGNYNDARRIAHKARSAANLGATRFSDIARRIEELPRDTTASEFADLQDKLCDAYTATETALSHHLSTTP